MQQLAINNLINRKYYDEEINYKEGYSSISCHIQARQ